MSAAGCLHGADGSVLRENPGDSAGASRIDRGWSGSHVGGAGADRIGRGGSVRAGNSCGARAVRGGAGCGNK